MNFFGGDPCNNVVKHFDGQVICSGPISTVPYQLNVVIPSGSTADVIIPIVPSLDQTLQNLVISEGTGSTSAVFWSKGTFYPGKVTGITEAMLNARKTAVVVKTVSGSYSFSSFNQ